MFIYMCTYVCVMRRSSDFSDSEKYSNGLVTFLQNTGMEKCRSLIMLVKMTEISL